MKDYQFTKKSPRENMPPEAEKGGRFNQPFPASMVLTPVSRNPIHLPPASVEAVMTRKVPGIRIEERTLAAGKMASLIVVTLDNLLFNRICLESVLANTQWPDYEIIVVDNGSTDGTRHYLGSLARRNPNLRVVLNDDNLGFAGAINQGMSLARGEFLVLLNNDILVTEGWLTRLVRHLEDPAIGLVGPVTNRTGNEAQIEITYDTYGEMLAFSRDYCRTHEGQTFDIRMLAMFCVVMRRSLYDEVGQLDEVFEVGLFEDDDYAVRARLRGYRVVCAEDVFVHHFGQASLGQLASTGESGRLFHANRRRWEEKWGCTWERYLYRRKPSYEELVDRIRGVVRATLPPDATVAVVSRGDPELLKLDGRSAWHFPQSAEGDYIGYHPADSAESIAHLESLRSKGAQFLLFPSTMLWWLEHYEALEEYLRDRFRKVVDEPDTCLIFDLNER